MISRGEGAVRHLSQSVRQQHLFGKAEAEPDGTVGGLVRTLPPVQQGRAELPVTEDGALKQLREKCHEQRDPPQVPFRRDGAPVDVCQVSHRLEGEKRDARRQRDGGHRHIHAQRRQIAQQKAGVLIIAQHQKIEYHRRGIHCLPVPPPRGHQQCRRPVAHAGHRECRQQPHTAPAIKHQAEHQQHAVACRPPPGGTEKITKQHCRQKSEQKRHTAKRHEKCSPLS